MLHIYMINDDTISVCKYNTAIKQQLTKPNENLVFYFTISPFKKMSLQVSGKI